MTSTVSTLDGYFKERYGDLVRAVPEFEVLAQDIRFRTRDKQGDSYHFPVRLRRAHGVTFAGGATAGTAFALTAAVSGLMKDANVSGTEFVLRESVAYGVVSRAKSSVEAFGDAFDEIVTDMRESAGFYREMMLLYGGTSIGAISPDPGGGPGARDVTITAATWAPGLWTQMEGAKIDVYSSDLQTKRNGNGALTVGEVDTENRTANLSGDETDLDNIADTDVIVPLGAESNWFDGIDKILTNTGSLFGIDAATYGLWKANTKSSGSAALTMAKVTGAASKSVVRGGMGKMKCYLSTFTWNDLNDDHAALRRFAQSTKSELDLGTQSIRYYGPNGEIEMKPHPMVKAGEAFLLQPEKFHRIGSTDLTFNLGIPGQDDRFFRELADNAGFELRCYWDQAIIGTRPACHTKITNIVNQTV